MLTKHEKLNLLKKFPRIELSYEKKNHKKVHPTTKNDLYLIIPKGKKHFLWFKTFKNSHTCFLLTLNYKKNSITDIIIKNVCFNPILCSGDGTILYGTSFFQNDYSFFYIENIFYYKNFELYNHTQYKKFVILNTIFNNYIKQIIYTKNDLIVGMPIVHSNYNTIMEYTNNSSFDIYSIQRRHLFKHCAFYNTPFVSQKKFYANFLVKPTIDTDIYHLYYYKNKKLEFYQTAYISDYTTSSFMNSLFRNIIENTNLDKIEESDDEDEFENTDPAQFTSLDTSYIFKCKYLRQFKMWEPLEISTASISKNTDIILQK